MKVIQTEVHRLGGTTWYNNNVDLFARVGEERMLIEAKSFNEYDTVNRMRYGIGQLADYAYRYQDELESPTKVLAFAQPPPRDAAWVGAVLDQERTAFISASENGIEPLNEAALRLPITKH